MKKLTNLLPALIDYRVTTKSQLDKRIESKLDNLKSLDRIQKFVADIYNIFDEIIIYKDNDVYSRINGKNVKYKKYS